MSDDKAMHQRMLEAMAQAMWGAADYWPAGWQQGMEAAAAVVRDAYPDAEGWRDIATAPTDGTTIDVWCDGFRETVYWGFRPHCCGEMGQYCDSEWHTEKEPGWVCSTFGEYVGCDEPFTHWRPYPVGPSAADSPDPEALADAKLREVIEQAAGWFDDYAQQHRAKGTDDGDRKAATNAERAVFLRAALSGGQRV